MRNYFKLGKLALKQIIKGVEFPAGISIDVTNKCNLKCKHCYFIENNYVQELSKEKIIQKVRELKKEYPSIIHASWVGGEPLLRKDVVEEGMSLFSFNMIVTNGTIELPSWENCVFNISIDGTKEYHENIRGKDTYDIIKKNIRKSNNRINLACVLNKENYRCIKDLLKEWKDTKVGGIVFDFYTPIKTKKEDLWIDWKKRDKIIEDLLELKKKYKGFILNTKLLLNSMRSKNSQKVTSNCLLPNGAISLDPMGNRKLPCILGKDADCSRCGCIIPFHLYNFKNLKGRIKSINRSLKTLM